jgi:phenylalanyl-tRNA synthetase alpha chain
LRVASLTLLESSGRRQGIESLNRPLARRLGRRADPSLEGASAVKIIDPEVLERALTLRDLTDPAQGPHAIQKILDAAVLALSQAWQCPTLTVRRHPVVSLADNYDALHYPADGAARDARYTRYVSPTQVLRTQTSALIPPTLRALSGAPPPEVLLVAPGLVWRRDVIDRVHVGEPHQVDLWRIRTRGPVLGTSDLAAMIASVAEAVVPGLPVRVTPAEHPYTVDGRQIDAKVAGLWVEIGECGLALPALLAEAGLPEASSGLAMGLGLDRLVMVRKGLDDIRLLRASDPRIGAQMLDLAPWRPVSNRPPVRRDLSISVPVETVAEELGDHVREVLGTQATDVEAVEVLSESPGEALPAVARERLGMLEGQKNVLLRVVLRAHDRNLTDAEANELRDAIYAALHQGTAWAWASAQASGNRGM